VVFLTGTDENTGGEYNDRSEQPTKAPFPMAFPEAAMVGTSRDF
jgi:hypothetical protein